MRRRTTIFSIAIALAVLAIGAVFFLRSRTAPEAARLLPKEAEGIIYFGFKPIRLAANFGDKPVSHEPEYEEFIRETGFQFERDLDDLAIAVHPPEPGEPQHRYSEIFVGRYDAGKLTHYLHKSAASVERYRDTDIFLIPHEGRTVRVAMLNANTVAASNTVDSKNIRDMVDRYQRVSLPFGGGPELLRSHYKYVPFGSTAWAIARLRDANGKGATLPLPGGVEFTLPKDTVTVASVRYLGSIQLTLEAFTEQKSEADKLAESVNTFLQLFRSVELSVQPSGADADVKAFFDSLKVENAGKRVTVSAQLPQGFVKKILSEPPSVAEPEAAPVKPKTQESKKKH